MADIPPPVPARPTLQMPMSPTLTVPMHSPFSSPRITPRGTPNRGSPWGSPRTSPRNSPVPSPVNSPCESPSTSPQASPQVARREPPPLPPGSSSDSDGNDFPPAIPERKKGKSNNCSKNPQKKADVNARKWADERQFTIGYADIDTTQSDTPFVPSTEKRANYAQLQYPGKQKLEDEDSDHNAPKTSTAFGDTEETDEFSSYDTPLPLLTHKEGVQENGLQNNGFGTSEDPFGFDPFKNDPFPENSGNKVVCEAASSTDKKNCPPSKSKSTDDVLNFELNLRENFNRSSCSSDTATMPRLGARSSAARLEARRSWSEGSHSGLKAGANAFSNPTYDGILDPSMLEEGESEVSRPAGAEAIQFYEEDFQILEAQGYSRKEIKKALIVADNNFAMARKILREFAQENGKK